MRFTEAKCQRLIQHRMLICPIPAFVICRDGEGAQVCELDHAGAGARRAADQRALALHAGAQRTPASHAACSGPVADRCRPSESRLACSGSAGHHDGATPAAISHESASLSRSFTSRSGTHGTTCRPQSCSCAGQSLAARSRKDPRAATGECRHAAPSGRSTKLSPSGQQWVVRRATSPEARGRRRRRGRARACGGRRARRGARS